MLDGGFDVSDGGGALDGVGGADDGGGGLEEVAGGGLSPGVDIPVVSCLLFKIPWPKARPPISTAVETDTMARRPMPMSDDLPPKRMFAVWRWSGSE